MRLAVISDARLPTLPDGGHGLGRSAHDISAGLAVYGHMVDLYAGVGSHSVYVSNVIEYESEALLSVTSFPSYDAILDTSHQHMISMSHDLPVVNRMADLECRWTPPNAVVNSPFMQGHYSGATLVNTGIDIEQIPLRLVPGCEDGHLAFMSFPIAHKGVLFARTFTELVGVRLDMINGVTGREKWDRLSMALALLHPSTIDAAPRLPLEAAACGVPTLCLDGDGASYHVEDEVTGFVCGSLEDMQSCLIDVQAGSLDPRAMRAWVRDEHGMDSMIACYESLLNRVAEGERW